MTLSHPPLGSFLRRLRPRYSKEHDGQAETSRLTPRERGVLTAKMKPNLIQSIVMTLAIAFAVPILPARVAAQGVLYSSLHSFYDGSVTDDGAQPFASLIRGSDGNFYGTTFNGGFGGAGTVFKMTPVGEVTILHSFYDGSVVDDGANPFASLTQDSDGNFYGTTAGGGSAGGGTVFKMTPAGEVTILHSFYDGSVTDDGANPLAALVQGSDGNFYGTTQFGGSADEGAVFTMTPAGEVTILHSFYDGSVTDDGAEPSASLIQGSDGNFYGTTQYGGSADEGTVFKMTPAGEVTVLHSFCDCSVADDGASPNASLIQGSDGNFYGTTIGGGLAGWGAVFKMTPAGEVTTLHSFYDCSVANDGAAPYGALIQCSNGNFYGTTAGGGSADSGTVFEMTPAGEIAILHSFCDCSAANDGVAPLASLIQDSDGDFYGTTFAGGSTNAGTVFKFSLPANHFSVSAAPTTTAGAAYAVTVTALNAFNNTATGYTGAVHFTSTDGAAGLPADATLTNGVGAFSATLNTAGSQAITATDTTASSITGTSDAIAVAPGAATHFTVTAPSASLTGLPLNVSVTALDAANNTATGYTGTVHFTSNDSAASLPTDATLTNGAGTFSATLNTVGSQTITATDTVTSSITETSSAITVYSPGAHHFSISAPATAVAGGTFSVTVTALDGLNNVVPGYTGTVKFTSTDGHAVLPVNSTLTNGVKTFSVTMRIAGNQTVTATDTVKASITGTSAVAVSAGPAARFRINLRGNAVTGSPYAGNVQATDLYGNSTPGYTGTVHFTSTDGAATLPADTTLTNGAANFTTTLYTVGSQTLTATDTVTPSMTSTSVPFTVVGRPATHFAISAPATAVQGAMVNYIVTALDASNNTATGYSGTVHFTSTDGAATLPADATLTNGVGTFPATLNTLGSQTITATDTVTSSIIGTSSAITVYSPGANHFSISAPATAVAGGTFSVTVTALDGGGNIVSNYGGTVKFTSTDGHAVLPVNSTLTNGTKTFNVTMRTSGSQTVTATDTATASITGAATITVAPAAPARFRINLRGNPKSGTPYQFTAQATDIFGNGTPGYTGTAHFTSTDGAATLPADTTLSGGIGSFAATFRTVGTQTFTLTDTVNTSITSTSAALAVAP